MSVINAHFLGAPKGALRYYPSGAHSQVARAVVPRGAVAPCVAVCHASGRPGQNATWGGSAELCENSSGDRGQRWTEIRGTGIAPLCSRGRPFGTPEGENAMNWSQLEGQWKQLKQQANRQVGKL